MELRDIIVPVHLHEAHYTNVHVWKPLLVLGWFFFSLFLLYSWENHANAIPFIVALENEVLFCSITDFQSTWIAAFFS